MSTNPAEHPEETPTSETQPEYAHNLAENVYDTGLALERTSLAWQRTVMALCVVGALVARYGPRMGERLLPSSFGLLAISASIGLLIWVRWRYKKTHYQLVEHHNLGTRDAKPLIVVVVLVVMSALAGMLYALRF